MKRLTNKDFLALLEKIEYNAGFLEVDSPCGCTEGEAVGKVGRGWRSTQTKDLVKGLRAQGTRPMMLMGKEVVHEFAPWLLGKGGIKAVRGHFWEEEL